MAQRAGRGPTREPRPRLWDDHVRVSSAQRTLHRPGHLSPLRPQLAPCPLEQVQVPDHNAGGKTGAGAKRREPRYAVWRVLIGLSLQDGQATRRPPVLGRPRPDQLLVPSERLPGALAGGVFRMAGGPSSSCCASVALVQTHHPGRRPRCQPAWLMARPFPAPLGDRRAPSFPVKPLWGFRRKWRGREETAAHRARSGVTSWSRVGEAHAALHLQTAGARCSVQERQPGEPQLGGACRQLGAEFLGPGCPLQSRPQAPGHPERLPAAAQSVLRDVGRAEPAGPPAPGAPLPESPEEEQKAGRQLPLCR